MVLEIKLNQSHLLIIQHILWMHISRASIDLKQSGPIESTMAIEFYQTPSWKNLKLQGRLDMISISTVFIDNDL